MATNGTGKRGAARGAKRPAGDGAIAGALAMGATRPEAAAAAGVSTRTVARRLSDPGFRATVADCRARITADVLTGAAVLAGRAVTRLGVLLDDDNPHVSLQAARTILTVAADFGERAELAERVAALEAVLKARAAA